MPIKMVKYYNKNTREYHCPHCDLTTKHPNNFAKHLSTLKHKRILYKKSNQTYKSDLQITFCNLAIIYQDIRAFGVPKRLLF